MGRCKNCGTKLNPGEKYCASCGTKVHAPQEDKVQKGNGFSIKKILILLVGIVLVIVVAFGIIPGLLKGSKDPFEKGITVTKKIKTGEQQTVGGIKETGWQLDIPTDTFGTQTELSMHVLSKEESQRYITSDAEMLATPVELKVEGQENVRLGQPVMITIKIPEEQRKSLVVEELFFGCYYEGQWDYYIPESVNMEEGTAVIKGEHFSLWGCFRPSQEEQIKTYAKTYAALQWESSKQKEKLRDALGKQYNDIFESMGVTNSKTRNQMTADMLTYLEYATDDLDGVAPIDALAQMANAATKGKEGMQDFQNKLLEFTGKGITNTLEKIHNAKPGSYTEKFSSSVNVIGNLSTALGAVSEGDKKGAMEAIASMLKGINPTVALASSTLEYVKDRMENTINYWTAGEIEKAYQIYNGEKSSRYGYGDELKGDINSIFILLGGGERMMNIRIVEKYCEKYGINPDDLSQTYKDWVVSNAMKALKNNFDQRKIDEKGIAKIQQDEEAFIAVLKEKSLLGFSSYQKYFGIDKLGSNFSISDRLTKLYQLKALVLSYVDEDKRASLSHKEIANLIEQWIHWSEKKQHEKFFQYLRDNGYNEQPIALDSTYGWVLVETKTNDWKSRLDQQNKSTQNSWRLDVTASSGSAEFTTTYIGNTDETLNMIKGMHETGKATWSAPSLQVIHPEEKFSVQLTVSHSSSTRKYPQGGWMVLGQIMQLDINGETMGAAEYLTNKDGESTFTTGAGNKMASFSETVYGTFRTGTEGDRMAICVSASRSLSVQTYYIYEWKAVGSE